MTRSEFQPGSSGAGRAQRTIPVTTTFTLPGWNIDRHVGACFGLIARSMGAGKDYAGLD
jgi:hypothetical protein